MGLIISCYIADLIFGDPEWLPHPVRAIGKLIGFLDRRLNKHDALLPGRIKGIILTFTVVTLSGYLAHLFITFANKLNPFLGNLAWVYLGYTALSIKDLSIKSKAVLTKLESDSLIEARLKLSQIVGRDTQNLSQEKIVKATIESIAESTNDGIVAPLFYLILGGPVSAIIYKAINTLDSMVGHKNEKYINFGWFPARLDDIMNFIPARIAGFLISLSSFVIGKNSVNAFKLMFRDGNKHPSPNSGVTEAAMAGALGIGLGGPSAYNGVLSNKPTLGEDAKPIKPILITEAFHISFVTSLLMVLIGVSLKWAI